MWIRNGKSDMEMVEERWQNKLFESVGGDSRHARLHDISFGLWQASYAIETHVLDVYYKEKYMVLM